MLIYCFDDTKRFAYTDVIADDVPVPVNATIMPPVNADGSGMYAPTWDGTKWVSMTEADFEKEFAQPQRPDNVPAITESQKQEAQYMLELAKMKANIAANSKTIAALTKQLNQTALNNKGVQ
ncbi:hypothetical protein [Ligilactobacillus animalis]|uniref:hypothetical protein n=1 Tax=Ligilactobacillus animalis TaxID=1605 RepID=UPI002904C8F6|nr:hypothetical protein [Ligilactobacillus animalis]MDU1488336.1 hypothetical protein [Ligilactobacillus animalis]